MATEVTSIALAVDSTQVTSASAALDKMAASGQKAETATDALQRTTSQFSNSRRSVDSVTEGFRRLGEQGRVAYDRLQASDKLTAGLSQAGRQAALTAQQIEKVGAASARAAPQATAAAAQIASQYKLTAQQATQLSFQLNDLFVQIASGGSPLIALIQQGSQLNGTFGGLSGTFRALATVFTATRVIIGGLVAGFAAVGLAALKGDQESAALQRTLLLTGNAAGLTEESFKSLAESVANATGSSVRSARETLTALAASGRFSAGSLREAGKATELLAKNTGQSTEDIIQQFVRAADGVSDFAQTANRQYNFLTGSQLQYIKTLEDQGEAQKALEFTLAELNRRQTEAAGSTGVLESAYRSLKSAVSDALLEFQDFSKELVFGPSVTKQIQEIDRQIAQLKKAGQDAPLLFGKSVLELENERNLLTASVRLNELRTKSAADAAAQRQAEAEFGKIVEQNLSKELRLEREIDRIKAVGLKAGASEAEIQKQIDAARERITPAKKDNSASQILKANLDRDLSAVRTSLNALTTEYRNAEQILEANRQAGLVSETDYYAQKRKLIDQNTNAQISALQRENELLDAQNVKGAERIRIDTQIAENKAKIAILAADADAKITLSTIQQDASVKKLAQSYADARAAQEAFLASIIRAQQIEAQGFGVGNQARDQMRSRQQLEERFLQQRLQLESERRRGQITQQQFEQELALIQEFQGKALNAEERGYQQRLAQQRDFNAGAREALQNYVDETRDIASQVEGAFSNAFKGLEDTLTEFVTSGKASFSDLATSIVADINRIIIRENVTGPLAEVIKGDLSQGGGLSGILNGFLGGGQSAGAAGAAGQAAGIAASTAALTAQTAATSANAVATTASTAAVTASTASVGALAAAEAAASAAISAASLTSAAAITAMGAAAGAAATALAAVAATSGQSSGGSIVSAIASIASGGRANGGPVSPGSVYRVNETGAPEIASIGGRDYLLTGSQGGKVMPTTNGGGGSVVVTVNQTFAPGTDRATLDQAASKAARALQTSIARGTA